MTAGAVRRMCASASPPRSSTIVRVADLCRADERAAVASTSAAPREARPQPRSQRIGAACS
jgi:hypothetical protein